MEKTSLTFQTFKNISYNMVGYIWPMFFSLVITPIIIFRLGIKNYGIYLFVNAIISLFGLLDLGLGTAVTKHMSHYYGKKDMVAISTLTHSANSLFAITSLLGIILSAGIASFGIDILPSSFASYAQYSSLFLIGGGIFFFSTVNLTYSAILVALQRFDISNKISMVSVTLSSLSILAVVLAGASLKTMFLVQLFVTAIFAVVVVRKATKILPQATLRFGWNAYEIKHCYQFGLVTFVNNIASSALASLDRLIIPFYVGPSNLTYYSLPGNVTSKIPGLSTTLSATIFPTTSQLDGEQQKIRIENLYIRSFRLITIIAAALMVTSIAYSYKILFYWINSDFANHSATILIILAFTNFILALLGPLSSFLLGLGKLKFLTTMSIFMGILNAVLLVILLPKYGITGAAWAYLLSILPVIYMFYYTEKKFLNLLHRKKYYTKIILRIAMVSLLALILDVYILSPLISSLPTLLTVGGSSVCIYLLLYKLFGFFEEEDWNDGELFLKKILHEKPHNWNNKKL